MSNNDQQDGYDQTEEEFPALHLTMVAPMPGLEGHTKFDLSAMDESGVLWTIRSKDDPQVHLFAVPPVAFFEGYDPQIPASSRDMLGLSPQDTPFILVIVHPAQGKYPHTANLLAPLVINAENMHGMQVVMEDQDWPLQAPIGDPKE